MSSNKDCLFSPTLLMTGIIAQCPPEILEHILNFIDDTTLQACRNVCKKWRFIANDIIQKKHSIWRTFRSKCHSKLSPRDIKNNIELWESVSLARVSTEIHPLKEKNNAAVKFMHVYRDYLIVGQEDELHGGYSADRNNTEIRYYNTEDFIILKSFNRNCVNFTETDNYIYCTPDYTTVELYGKTSKTSHLDPATLHVLHDPLFFRLEVDSAYMIDNRGKIFCLKWKGNNWDQFFLARYYNNSKKIINMNCENGVYLLTLDWNILKVDEKMKQLTKLHSIQQFVYWKTWNVYSTDTVMLQSGNVLLNCQYNLCKDRDNTMVISVQRTEKNNGAVMVSSAAFSSVVEHGEMLIILSNKIEGHQLRVYSIKKMLNGSVLPEISYDLHLEQDNEICDIDVHETKNGHCVLVRTTKAILKYILSYPETMQDS